MKYNDPLSLEQEYKGIPVPSEMSPYPTFTYESEEELPIPDAGTMTVRYRTTREERRIDADGDEHHVCTVELIEILEAKEDAESVSPSKSYNKDSEDALDKLAAEYGSKENDSEGY